jgi:hypothetical protein
MAAATAAECHALTSYYIKEYKDRYDKAPVVNRNIAKVHFQNMLMDYTSDEIKEMIEFFFTTATTSNHKITDLFYGYDKLIEAMQQHNADVDFRKKLKEETKHRRDEWLASGKKGLGVEQ